MSIRDHFHWGHDMKFHGENQFPEYFAGGHENGEYERMTDAAKERPGTRTTSRRTRPSSSQMKSGELSADDILRWKYQRYITDYLKCIQAVDDGVGRLLDYLDETGLAENTIVIYSSDQGFYLGEHGWYDKRWMFEESLRMPFIIRWPGTIDPGTRIRRLDSEHRLRSDLSGSRRCRRAGEDAGSQPGAGAPQDGASRGRLARLRSTTPTTKTRPCTPCRSTTVSAPALQADVLSAHARVATVRPADGSAGNAQRPCQPRTTRTCWPGMQKRYRDLRAVL